MNRAVEQEIILVAYRHPDFTIQERLQLFPIAAKITCDVIFLPVFKCLFVYLACYCITNGFRVTVFSSGTEYSIERMHLLAAIDDLFHLVSLPCTGPGIIARHGGHIAQ